VRIADNALEETFFTAGDNLAAAATTQFDLVAVAVEDRQRRLKALGVTVLIFLVVILLLGLILPGPAASSDQGESHQADQSATL
jgi:hypothetical protein